jgi:hypothetical protein
MFCFSADDASWTFGLDALIASHCRVDYCGMVVEVICGEVLRLAAGLAECGIARWTVGSSTELIFRC